MLVYAYARYSTDKQTDNSIEQQFEEINKYAKNKNYNIINYYHDSAASGQKDSRENFQKMIDDCIRKKEVEAILVWKLDRFARNRYDSAMYKNKLKNVGIRVISITQKIDNSPEGIILEGLLEAMDEYYCANLSANVKRKLYQNAEQCKFNGGFPPLGYDIDENKNYVINEKEAKIVREMFDLYEEGKSLIEITNIFNKKGYKTKRGTEFKKNSLYDMIGNERYAGYYIYSKSKNHNKRVKRDDVIRIEDGIPAIISKERMKKIMEKREQNKHKSFKTTERYSLSGILYCDKCGKIYHGKKHTKKNKNGTNSYNYYYRCDCEHSRSFKKDYIEQIVINCIKNEIINSIEIKELTEKLNELYIKRKEDKQNDELELKSELKEINRQLDNITQAVLNGIFNSNIKEKSDLLEQRKNDIEMMLNIAKEESYRNVITIDEVKQILEDDFKNFDELDGNMKKAIVKKWVKKIRVMESEIIITLNLIPETIQSSVKSSIGLAPCVRLERTTLRLTAACSAN